MPKCPFHEEDKRVPKACRTCIHYSKTAGCLKPALAKLVVLAHIIDGLEVTA